MTGLSVMHKQKGFTLLEVQLTVAMLALGFGVLVPIYLAVAHSTSNVYARHVAVQVIEEMAQVLPNYPNEIDLLVARSVNEASNPDFSQTCFMGSQCTHQGMLMVWWHSWQDTIAQYLPEGKLTIQCAHQCKVGQQLLISIFWQPLKQDNLSTTPAMTTDTSIICPSKYCVEFSWQL